MIRLCQRALPPRIRICRVPTGRPGTLVTARLIRDMIREGAKDFIVRQKAIEIFRQSCVPAKDRWGEVCALFRWVRKNIRYTRDIYRVELLHTPRRMLQLRSGDCDDFCVLLGSMLVATGYPVRLALTGFRPDKPHTYSHIYLHTLVSRKWVALDATMDRPIGWEPPALWKRLCKV